MKGVKLSRKHAVVAIVAGDLLLLALGWFMLVSPQRSTASSNARAAAAAEAQVAQAREEAAKPAKVTQPKQPTIRTAYLYSLSKAMPMTMDMPNLLLELDQVVRAAGVDLRSISPTAPDATGTATITISASGNFYSLTDLVYRLRSLVAVRDGTLDVSGRLFSIKSIGLTPTGEGRTLNASIAVNTYTFTSATPVAVPGATTPAVPAAGSTTTTTTDTTSASADAAP